MDTEHPEGLRSGSVNTLDEPQADRSSVFGVSVSHSRQLGLMLLHVTTLFEILEGHRVTFQLWLPDVILAGTCNLLAMAARMQQA
jgi:hypothetical protein